MDLLYSRGAFYAAFLVWPDEAGHALRSYPMPSGVSLQGVRIPDHGRRPLPAGVIAISKEFKLSVCQDEIIQELRFTMQVLNASKAVGDFDVV